MDTITRSVETRILFFLTLSVKGLMNVNLISYALWLFQNLKCVLRANFKKKCFWIKIFSLKILFDQFFNVRILTSKIFDNG